MLTFSPMNIKTESADALVIPVCADKQIHQNRSISALTKQALEYAEFTGAGGERLTLFGQPGVAAARVLFMGIGKAAELTAESFRKMAGRAVRHAMKSRLTRIAVVVPAAAKSGIEIETLITALAEGACLGNHQFDRFKAEKKIEPLAEIGLWMKAQDARRFAHLPEKIDTICRATRLAREWVSLPANEKRPPDYAADIAEKAEAAGLTVTVLDDAELERRKFGALLAVARGSEARPRLVAMEYRHPDATRQICLVGKGVTFDTGGLNLKISGSMTNMKTDMAGSAAVAASLIAVAALAPPVNVVGVLPIVENMVSGAATRPGDIITSYLGKTVEIGNTDAEGRLILIDAMAYAIETWKPDILVDLATLTGACVVALGEKIAGLFSSEEELVSAILASAEQTHERCWRMPLPDDYRELLKSDFADINNNSSSKYGGALTAALFLSAFVSDTRWAHIDIAGPAYATKAGDYCGPGGTGFGVRLLCDLLERLAE